MLEKFVLKHSVVDNIYTCLTLCMGCPVHIFDKSWHALPYAFSALLDFYSTLKCTAVSEMVILAC